MKLKYIVIWNERSCGAVRFLHSGAHPVSYQVFPFAQIQPLEMATEVYTTLLT